jgi:hypothetical protein
MSCVLRKLMSLSLSFDAMTDGRGHYGAEPSLDKETTKWTTRRKNYRIVKVTRIQHHRAK